MDWSSFGYGLLTGGGAVSVVRLLIDWVRERREQRTAKTSAEKERPRFRIDVSIVPTSHSAVPAAVVELQSLGTLPLTIHQGEMFIEASHYPGPDQSQKFAGNISPNAPLAIRFLLPPKLLTPLSGEEPDVRIVCKFSHSGSTSAEHYECNYNRRTRQFESAVSVTQQ